MLSRSDVDDVARGLDAHELAAEADAIARALAARSDPVHYRNADDSLYCWLCGARAAWARELAHVDGCPWVRARAYVEAAKGAGA